MKTPAEAPVSPKSSSTLAVLAGLLAASGAVGCGAESDKQTYDPVALGMTSNDPPLYDDGESTIYEVTRAVSFPINVPTSADLATLSAVVPPYTRTPWITNKDVKVQVTWTISNLDKQAHNVEILLDPWNEFARYVPGVNMGEEETVPDLSGIDILLRVEGMSRKKGIFTFDDMDEVATDLATVENIIGLGTVDGVNGLVNHAFEIHNRSSEDRLIKGYIPPIIAGLVGFDVGLRAFGQGNVALEIIVEITDFVGNRVSTEQPLKLDGTMWITPEATLTAPAAEVP
ncbi:MAG TPA: hypothetical protein VK540_17645 [Polyangiaceae bacterium]|nr:hypothetical protein [Polyangiaceae bacterium]